MMILPYLLLHMSAILVDGSVWHSIDAGNLPLPTSEMMTEKATSSEIACTMEASLNNCPFYCYGDNRCLVVEERNLVKLNLQNDGTSMKDLQTNLKCKMNQGRWWCIDISISSFDKFYMNIKYPCKETLILM